MVAVAIGGAAIVGAGASIASSSKASDTAKQTADQNNAFQAQIYGQNAATLNPYETRGNEAGTAINSLLGLSNDPTAANAAFNAFENSTGYQARLKQGQDSVTAALGSKGLLDSGAAQKALTEYGQTQASNEFANYAGLLQGQQQTGLAAASAQAGVGQNYANAVTNSNNNASNTSANASLAQGSAINGALGNLVSAYGYNQGAALGSSYGTNAYNAGSLTNYANNIGSTAATSIPINWGV